MTNKKLSGTAFLLCFIILLLTFSDLLLLQAKENNYNISSSNNEYQNYSESDIIINAAGYSEKDNCKLKTEEYKSKKDVLIWQDGNGSIAWNVTVPKNSLYNFALSYFPLTDNTDIELELSVDGKLPFEGAQKLVFSRDWKNATVEPRTDSEGNEIAQEQVETGKIVYRLATDYTGVETEPLLISMSKGEHTITLSGKGYSVALYQLGLKAPEKTPSYDEVSKKYNISIGSYVEPIIIEGEKADVKSDNVLISKSDLGNASMNPADPYKDKLNYIGGSNWQDPGQTISWNFDVKKEGYYSFATRYKQNELVNGESWRWLKIDGKTPFKEAKELRFSYGTGWKNYEFSKGKDKYYFWLDKGRHTVSLEVNLGELADYYDRLNKVVKTLGDLYLQIVMITGETPDTNRDYELFNQIPQFNDILKESKKQLSSLVEDMKQLTGKQGSQYTSAIGGMNRVIGKMIASPYFAHIYVKDFYTNYTALCSWLNEMKKMPLSIDELRFIYAGQDFDKKDCNIFDGFVFGIKRLLKSYVADYKAKDLTDNNAVTLKLWVNWGRDQTMALDSLIRDSFSTKTGINVDVQIVNNSLINGLLANNFPDIQLQLARTDPVNFGIRGALIDLKQFGDYSDILKRFQKDAELPYTYNDALYALPDQQTYYCMFYRKDVFNKLGISVPVTWDEFLDCSTVIQRKNMGVYVPYTQITTTTTVNSGIGSLNLYPTLMAQNGLSLYNDKLNVTALNTEKGIKVFEEWTQMYSDYGYLKEADFYNRFRNGSMPLGIAPYTTYMTFYSAAPELKDRWAIANVPGIDTNNSVIGGGTGCSIVKKTHYPNEAWEFLKWWTSEETQSRYSKNVESILGMLGRIPTSNVEAFKSLSWNPSDLKALLSQWNSVKELEEVPGSYYLSRAVDQAFWSVINDDINPKDAITKWSKVADKEIERKIKEYQ